MAKGKVTLWGLRPSSFSRAKRWQVPTVEELERLASVLTATELAWLSRFNLEFHGGGPKKGEVESLHASDELRKDCYNKANAANRCAMSRGMRIVLSEGNDVAVNVEDVLIQIVDELRKQERKHMKKTKSANPLATVLPAKAVGISQQVNGEWVAYVISFHGDGTFDLDLSVPNERAIALSEAQVLFANTFIP
jgi:hypothetical protein